MRLRKLQDNILIAIISVVFLLSFAWAVIINGILTHKFSNEMEKMGIRMAQDIARQSSKYILLKDMLDLQTLINGYKRAETNIEYIFIITVKSDILAHTFKEGLPFELKRTLDTGEYKGNYSVKPLIIQGKKVFDISAPILKGEIGVVHLGISSRFIEKIRDDILGLIVTIILISLLLCGILGTVWAKGLTKSILELLKGAQAVSNGDFALRIKVVSQDEIGELAIAFNKMSDILQTTTVSREFLSAIFNSMMDILIIIDKNGLITDINETALCLLGYKKEEILGQSLNMVLFGEKTELLLKKISASHVVKDEEKTYLTKDNKKIPVSFWASEVPDLLGAVKVIVCVAQDITKHKLLQERLTRINDCLLDFKIDPEQNIKSLVSVCSEVLGANCAFYYNINGGVVCSQKQWEIPADLNISKDVKGHIYHDIVQQGLDAVVVCTDLPKTPYQQTDTNVRRYNLKAYMGRVVKLAGEVMGSLSVFYQNDVVITKEDKRVLGTMCAAIATEERRKKAEKELKDSYDSLKSAQAQLLQKDKMANMGQLAGSVAHEINNPLTGVLNNAQLIKMMFEANQHIEPGELKELLNVIEESALRCKKITESLLDFSHSSIGEFQRLSLNGVIEKVTGLFYTEMKLQNINIKKELQPSIADIQGDSQLLQQIITNLISNAKWAIEKKFGKTGGGLITIKSEADSENKHIYLYLTDNGIGIPEDKVGKIFEPFFTTKQVGVGTGLGLSLVSGIIRKHKGSIEVQSKINEGTTFKISLPAVV